MEENLVWFYFDQKESDPKKAEKGPFSLRDLDVLIRTGILNSSTLIFKEQLHSWTRLYDIPELKSILQEQAQEIFALQSQRNGLERQNHNLEVTLSPANSNNHLQSYPIPNLEEQIIEEHKPLLEVINKFEAEIEEIEGNNHLNDDEKRELIKKKIEKNRKKTEKEKQKKKQKWYTPKINTNVYVSGLPPQITEEQLCEFFQKAGVIRINPQTMKPIVKIYRGSDNKCKGDGLVSFKMVESVSIAKEVLDEKEIMQKQKTRYRVSIQEAHFEQKGDYKEREAKRNDKLKQEIAKQKEKNMMSWEDEKGVEIHGLKIVILKNMFTPEQAQIQNFFVELEPEIKEEIEASVGEIVKMEIFEKHPDGVIKIKFSNSYDADQCIGIMNGRYFEKRKIQCDYWDGKTDYKRESDKETILDEQKRLDEFGKWIEEGTQLENQPLVKQIIKD